MSKTHDEPSDVTAENGEVLVDGPGGVPVSLSPDTAAETGERLIVHAAQAHGQRITGQVVGRQDV